MMVRNINLLIVCLLLIGLATPVFAVVMSSTNYQIDRDSIDFTGGIGSSTSYVSESTLGEAGTGPSTSTSYSVQAGFQQMEGSWVSISVPANASLTPSINVAVGGIASTSANFLVQTNNGSGYTMQMRASTSPALKGETANFADYTIASLPDYAWSVASADAEFGFTPEGSDIVRRYRDDGVSACNQLGGIDSSDICWDQASTTYATISQSAAPNFPATTATAIKFRAEAGSASSITIGNYVANIIVTAYTN